MVRSSTFHKYRDIALDHIENCSSGPVPLRQVIRAKKDVNAYNEVVEAVNRMRKDYKPPKPETWAPKKKFDETEVMILSDLHFGKKVEIEGKVQFDKTIATDRFKAITSGMRHLNDSYITPNHSIDELVVVLLGDIVDGELIYQGQAYNQDMPLLDQTVYAATLIKKELINPAAKLFNRVRVVSVSGNHGEVRNDRGEHVMHPKTNFDSLAALMLQMGCADLPNVTFDIATTTLHTAMIRRWKFFMAHKLPNPSGSPGRSKYGGYFERFRYDAVLRAHFHVPELAYYNTKPVIMNGSLPGTDDYALELSFNTVPTQVLFTVSDKRPVALFWQVDVGERTKEVDLAAGSVRG